MRFRSWGVLGDMRGWLLSISILFVFFFLSLIPAIGLNAGPLHIHQNALTFDEISHIGSSFDYMHSHKLLLNPEHPPIVKIVAGTPLQFIHLQPGKIDPKLMMRDDGQWNYGRDFLFNKNAGRTNIIIRVARLTTILFNTALLLVIYLLLRRLVSVRAALVALTLLAFNPAILGNSGLVTYDAPSALTITICLLSFVFYLRKPALKQALWVGVALGFALATNFTATFLLPFLGLACLLWLLLNKVFKKSWLATTGHLASIFVLAFIVVGTIYLPLTSGIPADSLHQQFDNNWPSHLNHLNERWLNKAANMGGYPRALASWANGALVVQRVVENGKAGTFFLGEVHGFGGAGLAYFPVLYATKVPLGTHLLSIGAITATLYVGFKKTTKKRLEQLLEYLRSPVIFSSLLFAITYLPFLMRSPFQIGFRHFFPFIGAFLIFVAVTVDRHWDLGRSVRFFQFYYLCLVLMIISSLISFPKYISYYNLAGGGTLNGYKIADDSNYDWGQDLSRLAAWRPGNCPGTLYTDLFVNPFGVENYYLGPTFRIDSLGNSSRIPAGNCVAVSTTNLVAEEYLHHLKHSSLYHKSYRVAPSIFVYKK